MEDMVLFEELTKHLLEDNTPSKYLIDCKRSGILKKSFLSVISDLEVINQEKKHHPEGNVFNHTIQVIDEAARQREKAHDKKVFMWAALLHDIGKKTTTKIRKGRLTAYNHDKVGAKESKEILGSVTTNEKFIGEVSSLIEYHMAYLYVMKSLPFIKIEDIVLNSDIYDVALLTYCDRVGRGKKTIEEKIEIINSINKFIEKVNSVSNKKYKKLDIIEK